MRLEECFNEIWKKYKSDPKVSEILKKIGPAFPLRGPHYDYADLIEHIGYSLLALCTCDPDELPERHLLEIYMRRQSLSERARDIAMLIPEEDYLYYSKSLDELIREWEKDFKRYFTKCVL